MALRKLNQHRQTADTSKNSGLNILYVEDDDDNWEITSLALRDRYNLQRAKESRVALNFLKKNSYNVILMDIELAGSPLNGIEITRKLKQASADLEIFGLYKKNEHTPVIFVTAYGARYSRQDLLAVGGADVIEKPVDFQRLSRVITRLTLKQTYKTLSSIDKTLNNDRF